MRQGGCVFGYGGSVGQGGGVRDGGRDFRNGSGVGDRCVRDGGSGNWGDSLDGNSGGFLADYGVETVDWVSDVVDGALGAIGLQKGVAALDDVAVAGLVLALGVAGQTVVHVVRVAVLGMRVEIGVHSLGDCGGCGVSYGGSRSDDTGVGNGHKGGESDKLQKITSVSFSFT